MNVLVALDARFDRLSDGSVWSTAAFDYKFWGRYLEVFDSVKVLARVRTISRAGEALMRADGPGVTFWPVPYFVGPWQRLLTARAIARSLRGVPGPDDAVLMRVASHVANLVYPAIQRGGRPYGLEVVGDPWDAFAPGAVRHPLRFAFRRWFAAGLRRQCANAWAVAYVNEATLQRRYPHSRPGCHVAHYSSVDLDERSFAAAARRVEPRARSTVVTIGSLEQMYKAPDVLIDAVAECVRRGTEVRLVLVGDGRHRRELEDRARGLGLGDRVVFRGQLPAGDAVRAELDAADLFVLPSRTEGLPRAMLEAMARGLPCLGSTAGGIPELLPPEDMVAPGDASALARATSDVLRSPSRMEAMSSRNLERARQYSAEILHARRLGLYRHLRAVTEEWRRTRGATSEKQP